MANDKPKSKLSVEQIKVNLIVWWVAMICLIGICFISVIYFQGRYESDPVIESLSSIKSKETANYGSNSEPIEISTYNTIVNGYTDRVYTYDPDTKVSIDDNFSKKARIEDDGIISILKNGVYISSDFSESERQAIVQLAIWMYKGYLTPEQEAVALRGKYASEINSLLKKANAESYAQSSVMVSIPSPSVSLSKDKKYYLSEAINLKFSNKVTVVDYKVILDDAPKGTKIIDDKGQVIKNINKVDKFYLKIPEESVNSENRSFSIGIDVTTANYYAYEFRNKNNNSAEADVILDDLQVAFTHTNNTVELNVNKEVPLKLIDSRTVLGFFALCITGAICGIIIFLLNVFTTDIKTKKKKATPKASKTATKAAAKKTVAATKAKTTAKPKEKATATKTPAKKTTKTAVKVPVKTTVRKTIKSTANASTKPVAKKTTTRTTRTTKKTTTKK